MPRRLISVLVAAAAVFAGVVSIPPASAATGKVVTIGPGANVSAAMTALRPGDVLRLQPGTYDISNGGAGIHPKLTPGTAASPIVVTAVDAAQPPLLKGFLFLDTATHWTIQYVRMQATVATRNALYVAGGVGWSVRKSEFFGAAATQSFANVAISNTASSGLPQHWQFVDNCVHDAGLGQGSGHDPDTDHNVYVAAAGNSPGLIARNVLYNATAGENVKIGNGDGTVGSGASNVHVMYNTMYNSRRQVLVVGKLTGDVIARNILVRSTRPTLGSGAVFYSLSQPGSAAIGHNFIYLAKPGWYAFPDASTKYVSDGGDDAVRTTDPLLAGTCGLYARNAAVAKAYGTKASGALTPVVP